MSGGKLPEGWVDTQLGNIVDYGKATKKVLSDVNDDTWVLELEDIEKESSKLLSTIRAGERKFKSTKNSFKKGDVLYGKLRPYLNKIIVAEEDGVCTTEIIPLSVEPSCFNKYIFFWLKSSTFQGYVNDVSYGVNMPRLGTADGLKAPLRLAPLAEQKIIAEKLDTLLAQVDSTKARLEQIPQILKRFRQAVMKLAITGELTSEYRNNFPTNLVQEIAGIVEKERIEKKIKNSKLSKEPYPAKIPFSIPKSWQWYRLGHISLKITDGAHNTPKVLSEGYPYIMAKDLTKGKLDFSEERFISEKDHKELYFKCAPEVGDLLVVNIGAGTGNNVLIDSDIEFSFKNIAIIKKSKLITPTYLKIFFDSQKNRIFNEQTKGGAQPFLSLSVLNDIPFALPPLPEQHEIVRRVEQLFAYADTIEKQVNNALTRVNSLTQSILAKAFRGELTAQWRADNPSLISGENSAAALLERIKAERAASSGKKNSRKKA
ncbi:TPA: restriction endonuclease subunit S [Enterobacter asburiae]|nr:restriction endonuclease subunit S [Enterobacter asburiae]HDS6505491.1 restriction endonuclease subunit S [Enterobacter asburiae]